MQTAKELLAGARPRRLALPARGVEIALLEWGERGPRVLAHHANGFCKGSFARVAAHVADRVRFVALDARGHGDSSRPEGAAAYVWPEFAEDLAAVARQLVQEDGEPLALGIGHSFGGTSMLGAVARAPDCFRRLLLIDPVVPPPPGAFPPGAVYESPLVQGARRRRARWPSRAAARDWFAARSLFADWRPEALDLYVLDGLRARADGEVELKCPGAVEAAVFSNAGGVDVPALARACPVPCRWLWAARGNFSRATYEALAAEMRDASVASVDAGHLIPMERPEIVAAEVAAQLAAGAAGRGAGGAGRSGGVPGVGARKSAGGAAGRSR